MRQGGICIKFSQHTSVNAHNNKENRAFLFSPVFSPTSLQPAKNACFSLIFPKNSAFRNGFELRRSDVKKDFFCNIFRRRSVESSSDNFRFFPINTVSCDIYQKTRNQFGSNATWVRIPPSAPKAAPCGALLFIFAANYARVARWDSNSPCPALCVPPGCNSPADCCKGAGESHRLRQVSLLNFTLGSDFFIAALQNPRAFLIDISPLFSSSDFRVRYKSYQQSRQIAIHRTTQDSSRSLGTN